MRRAVITLGSTLAGLAALLSFKTHSLASGVSAQGAPALPAPASPAMASGTAAGSALSATRAGSAKASGKATAAAGQATAASGKASASPTASTAAARTVTGAVANTPYGPMQVQVTLMGQRITGVTVVQQTNVGARSQQIDSFAIPQLTKETLAAQSARIDAVSGASYTSSGYIQSLQSALDQVAA